MSHVVQLCTFRLGSQLLGVEVERVQEVLRWQEMTRVPHASAAVAGLINLRGQIVTAIDLRVRFGDAAATGASEAMNVVVRVDGGITSLLVDEIGDVLEIDADQIEEPPPTLAGPTRDLVRGIHQLADDLLLLLDVEQVLDFDAACAAPAQGGIPHTTTLAKRNPQ
ncbi:MAG: chemotaxis protein CheW [Planctomycetota bacterium]